LLGRKEVAGCLDYAHRTLFSHIQLYLACLRRKQVNREKQITIMANVPQTAKTGGLDCDNCKEVLDDDGMADATGID